MNVELFVLCDAATDYQGKLNILGTFDSVWSRQVPAVHPLCAVALRLRFQKYEEGDHKVEISITDERGAAVVKPLEARVNVLFKSTSFDTLSTNMILNLQGLSFPHYGEYSVVLAIDGKQEGQLPLLVNKMPGSLDN